jgi:hypothetical protein
MFENSNIAKQRIVSEDHETIVKQEKKKDMRFNGLKSKKFA